MYVGYVCQLTPFQKRLTAFLSRNLNGQRSLLRAMWGLQKIDENSVAREKSKQERLSTAGVRQALILPAVSYYHQGAGEEGECFASKSLGLELPADAVQASVRGRRAEIFLWMYTRELGKPPANQKKQIP